MRNRHGLFEGDLSSHIERELYLFGGYEDDLIDRFIALSRRRGLALDIGANIGSHTVALAQQFKRVIAFEPNPAVLGTLERNVALNRLSNVEIRRIAVGDQPGRAELHDVAGGNRGLASLLSDQDEYAGQFNMVYETEMARLDDLLPNEIVDAIKMDIQGYEPNAFAGMQQLLERSRPVVWSEVSLETLNQIGAEGASRFFPFEVEILKIERVRRFGIYRTELQPCSRITSFGDYFFVPK